MFSQEVGIGEAGGRKGTGRVWEVGKCQLCGSSNIHGGEPPMQGHGYNTWSLSPRAPRLVERSDQLRETPWHQPASWADDHKLLSPE